MLKTTRAAVIAIMMAGACLAQNQGKEADNAKYFHLDFVVKEVDGGKVVSARHYTASTATGDANLSGCSIRAGSKVPAPSSGGQFTYLDVGVNIDCRGSKEVDGNLTLNVTAEVSSAITASTPPVIRQNRWNANVAVPLGKPTVVFSSDDMTTKGQMQLELTATPLR